MRRLAAILAAVLLSLAGLSGVAHAGHEYSMDQRPVVVFPGGKKHVSPYPMGKRAAAVWASDFCWKDCTGQSAWRFESCIRRAHPEVCRVHLDADDRICLRACRSRGGPLLNITD